MCPLTIQRTLRTKELLDSHFMKHFYADVSSQTQLKNPSGSNHALMMTHTIRLKRLSVRRYSKNGTIV